MKTKNRVKDRKKKEVKAHCNEIMIGKWLRKCERGEGRMTNKNIKRGGGKSQTTREREGRERRQIETYKDR